MTVFKDEAQVRKWLSQWCKDNAAGLFWVENKGGGTHGFPDAIMIREGRSLYVELKVGVWHYTKMTFEARNPQRIVMRQLTALGATGLWLIGEKNTENLWVARAMDVKVEPKKISVDGLSMVGGHSTVRPEPVHGGTDFFGKF